MDTNVLDRILALRQLRDASFLAEDERFVRAEQQLRSRGLPLYGSENYQRTDLSSFFDGLFSLLPSKVGLSIWSDKAREGELYCGSLSEYLRVLPQKTIEVFGSDLPDRDAYALLNQALDSDAYLLYIPSNMRIEEPIELVFTDDQTGSLLSRRLYIVLEEQAVAKVIIKDKSKAEISVLQSINIRLGDTARLNVHEEVLSQDSAKRIATYCVDLYRGAVLEFGEYTVSCGLNRNNIHARLLAPGAEIHLKGLALATNRRVVDNFVWIEHLAPHCHTDELFKYVVDGEGSGVFSGRIFVDQIAQKTVAYQNNRNLLLCGDARMQSKPQLEIYADDVKCSHGMTTGQLDESALFYLRQRGIPYRLARKMLIKAFAEEVIAHIDEYSLLAEELHMAIERELT